MFYCISPVYLTHFLIFSHEGSFSLTAKKGSSRSSEDKLFYQKPPSLSLIQSHVKLM